MFRSSCGTTRSWSRPPRRHLPGGSHTAPAARPAVAQTLPSRPNGPPSSTSRKNRSIRADRFFAFGKNHAMTGSSSKARAKVRARAGNSDRCTSRTAAATPRIVKRRTPTGRLDGPAVRSRARSVVRAASRADVERCGAMPYSSGRVVHDADAHLMETPTWLRDHADPALRDRIQPLRYPGGNELRQTGDPAEQQRDLNAAFDRLADRHRSDAYRATEADEIML